ncbi:hypothetical protein [Schlesneria sp.]|uniref:hypothetical protein n=1 Tax=Schlesneria sp. TaxID=2762018 RepID=UPI002EF08B03
MNETLRVLGIDLASRSWQDNGSAILGFTSGDAAAWQTVECGCIDWPDIQLSPKSMAQTIEKIVRERNIAAVSLDGPQGWREPLAGERRGVGRVCEYEARCQGKTGEYGRTYPQTQHGWIKFCIDVFAELVSLGNAHIANSAVDPGANTMEPGCYWLLECFPTSTWRASRLAVLPGKSRIGSNHNLIATYAKSLQERYGLPQLAPWNGTHDDLQAIVAALPAVGYLNGPCLAIPKGKAGGTVGVGNTSHKIEGIIWDATLPEKDLGNAVTLPAELPKRKSRKRQKDGNNPLLIDNRDDDGDRLLDRGVRLFRYLAQCANAGKAVGVGYAQLVCCVHAVERFEQVAGRDYAQPDTSHVLRFARQITDQSGGPISVCRTGVTIDVGMDAFVWRKKPKHKRPSNAFKGSSYSQKQWKTVFPDGSRQLLSNEECNTAVTSQVATDQDAMVDQQMKLMKVKSEQRGIA